MALRLSGLRFGPGSDELEARRDRVVAGIGSYLIPRTIDPSQPLIVVFAGPTGAGKSTLLNSVAGADLSRTGALRPTTVAPIVFTSEGAGHDYRMIGDVQCETVEGRLPILGEMCLVDTPDIDSTEPGHRVMAETLMDNADVVVFVSSALRYADLVPWAVLRRAESRGAPVLHVLNRIRPRSEGAVFDYRRLLEAEGFDSRLIPVAEHRIGLGAQSIPTEAVRPLRRALVGQIESGKAANRETFRRVLASTCDQAAELVQSAGEWTHEMATFLGTVEVMFQIGIEDLRFDLSEIDFPAIPVSEIEELRGVSPRRVRRWLRRRAPHSDDLAVARNRLVDSVVTRVESQMRVAGSEVFNQLDTPTFEMIRFAVERWSLAYRFVGRHRELPSLLVAISAISPEPWAQDLIEILVPDSDPDRLRATTSSLLEAELEPVLERLRSLTVRARADAYSASAAIDEAQTSVANVIAGSAFAHA